MSHGDGHGHGNGHSHGGHACAGHGAEAAALPEALEQGLPLLPSSAAADNLALEQRKLTRAVYFALFMMFVEIVGGVLSNSLAVVTDAAHMLSDVGGFVVSLLCLQLASKGVTAEYTFGFKQAEVLGALGSIAIVWLLTAVLLYEAVWRFYELQEINGKYMLGISVLGFFVNVILMMVLGHSHGGHGHGGGSCHGHGGGDDSLAMKAAIAHVIGDIVQSLGVCLASLCIWLRPFDVGVTANGVSKWNYADPMCTVLFGVLVLLTTKSTLTETINSLMVKAPVHINSAQLTDRLKKLPNVQSVHDLHVWALGSKDVLCMAHVMVEGREHGMEALKAAIAVAQSFGIGHSTFQVEIVGEFDPMTESYGLHGNPLDVPKELAAVAAVGAAPGHGEGHGHSHGGHGAGHGHAH